MVILPKDYAYDFLLFCVRNQKSCPLIEVTDVGSPYCSGGDIDLRMDIPRYRVFQHGTFTDEPLDIKDYWQNDFVGFLIGCSFTFEHALITGGIPMKHIQQGKNVAMYVSNIECSQAGMFSGKTVVSMRPIHQSQVELAVEITAKYPHTHGAPIHIGHPKLIGIEDIYRPDFGDNITIEPSEIPVFWACGVTPQVVCLNGKPEIMITHAPGHMLITNYLIKDF